MSDLTRYEIAARHTDGRAFLIGFTPRKSRPGILAAMRGRAPTIIAALGIREDSVLSWGRDAATTSCGWRIAFTGRTQKDVTERGGDPLPPLH